MLGAEFERPHYELYGSDARAALQKKKFYFRKAEKKDRLWTLYHRMQRGLPSYDQWTVPQLEGRFKARRLTIFAEKVRKTDLVEALELSDEDVRFEKFMDLPPELRVRIYTMHLQDLPTLPDGPHQPPICLVSSQIRKESLPLFYSKCVFNLWLNASFKYFTFRTFFEKFVAYTSKDNLARIKKVKLKVLNSAGQQSDWYVDASMEGQRMNSSPAVRLDKGLPKKSGGDEQVIEATLIKIVQSEPEILIKAIIQVLFSTLTGEST